jgi:hypothetical protein
MDLDRTTTALLTGLLDPANAAAWELFDRRYRSILVGFARNCGLKDNDAAEIAQATIVRFVEEYRAGRYDRTRGRLGASLRTQPRAGAWGGRRPRGRIAEGAGQPGQHRRAPFAGVRQHRRRQLPGPQFVAGHAVPEAGPGHQALPQVAVGPH